MFMIKKYINLIIMSVMMLIIGYIGVKIHSLTMQVERKNTEIYKLKEQYQNERNERIVAANESIALQEKVRDLSAIITEEAEEEVVRGITTINSVEDEMVRRIMSSLKPTTVKTIYIENNVTKPSKDSVNIDSIYFMYENATGEKL